MTGNWHTYWYSCTLALKCEGTLDDFSFAINTTRCKKFNQHFDASERIMYAKIVHMVFML